MSNTRRHPLLIVAGVVALVAVVAMVLDPPTRNCTTPLIAALGLV